MPRIIERLTARLKDQLDHAKLHEQVAVDNNWNKVVSNVAKHNEWKAKNALSSSAANASTQPVPGGRGIVAAEPRSLPPPPPTLYGTTKVDAISAPIAK